MLIFILQAIFFSAAIIQILFWLFVFSRLAFKKVEKVEKETTPSVSHDFGQAFPPVSIIICARNEAKNLTKNLPLILKQNYPNFEVVVVNDDSTDETPSVLNAFSEQNPHLRVLHLSEKKIAGKKGALAKGIEIAHHEILLLTDADCYPLSIEWVSQMVAGLGDKEIGLAYAPYESRDSFLNLFIRFETVWTATQYFGLALVGMPYMGVGRNLIYRKKLYEKVGGFANHLKIMSGDDDLFAQSVLTKNNFSIILNPETFMFSEPKTQWKSYFTQKKRHISAATHYTRPIQMVLGLLSASHFFYFVTAVLLLALKISTMFVLIIIVVRTCLMWFLYGRIMKMLSELKLLRWMPILDAVYVLFYVLLAPALTFRTQKWQ